MIGGDAMIRRFPTLYWVFKVLGNYKVFAHAPEFPISPASSSRFHAHFASERDVTGGGDDKPSEPEKRRVYVLFFCMALLIDLAVSTFRGEAYHPTMIGLAVMIASLAFFVWSWLRNRK